MSRWKLAGGLVALTVLVSVGVALAQEGAGGGGRGGGRRQWGGGRWDPEQMRQMMLDRMKESLGATDEEWTVLAPRFEKVTRLAREAGGGFMRGGGFGGRARRGTWGGGPGEGAAQEPQTATAKASDALRTTLEDESSSPDQIKKLLTAYRAAREKARQELAKAQEELREVLSVRQEAQLVLTGTLE